jgi:hypothetical protein
MLRCAGAGREAWVTIARRLRVDVPRRGQFDGDAWNAVRAGVIQE